MSTSLTAPAQPATRRRFALPAWTREPLLHFILLGALLFGLDHYFSARANNPRKILVTAEVDDNASQIFRAARGRAPTAEELAVLRQRWLDEELLYREGLALGVDRGDKAIRDRVVFKSLSVIDAGLKLPRYDDASLRAWFEAHRDKYAQPARYDFEEAVLAGHPGDAEVDAFVEALRNGLPGDAKAGLRVFKGRPRASLEQTYGADFVSALDRAQPSAWHALRSHGGLRAIRLQNIAPPQPADYETLRNIVLQDWTDASMAERRTAAVRELAKKYEIVREEAPR